ncbi:MAG: 5-(carboxyamino)imidazole ribonucleotide synthase [Verrucomicrobiales bacterium]|jgi:5-(carboxyamino)imidazole ribonucleotide synthase
MIDTAPTPDRSPAQKPGLLQPGKTIGIVGGGQLGRMLTREVRRMGYRAVIFTDEYPPSPAGQLADREINAPYYDPEATATFIREIDVATIEFENIPAELLTAVEQRVPVYPSQHALTICQNREKEKNFLRQQSIPHAEFRVVDSGASLGAAVADLGMPCILKTAAFGYDGKGQRKITHEEDWETVWQEFGASRGVVEQWVDFQCEVSVVCARSIAGEIAHFPLAENIHVNQILDTTIVPARCTTDALQKEAQQLATEIAEALDFVGTFCVEIFIAQDGSLLVNEMAPRPHNSGHFTIDACKTNQFEQQLRAVAGLPLGDPSLLSGVVMKNLLGDLWLSPTEPPNWSDVLKEPNTKLHLYGKRVGRPGRKMGHFCVLGEPEEALETANRLFQQLVNQGKSEKQA